MSKPAFHFDCKRWFQRTYGNTYHSVRILKDGVQIAYIPFEYGYGEQCLQTALDTLRTMGEIPTLEGHRQRYGTQYIREELNSTYQITDVNRKRDL